MHKPIRLRNERDTVDGNIYDEHPFSPIIEESSEAHSIDLSASRHLIGKLVSLYRYEMRFKDGGDRLAEDLTRKEYLRTRKLGPSHVVATRIRQALHDITPGRLEDDDIDNHLDNLVTIGNGLLPYEYWYQYLRKYITSKKGPTRYPFQFDGTPAKSISPMLRPPTYPVFAAEFKSWAIIKSVS